MVAKSLQKKNKPDEYQTTINKENIGVKPATLNTSNIDRDLFPNVDSPEQLFELIQRITGKLTDLDQMRYII
jgi:hypothetical protein